MDTDKQATDDTGFQVWELWDLEEHAQAMEEFFFHPDKQTRLMAINGYWLAVRVEELIDVYNGEYERAYFNRLFAHWLSQDLITVEDYSPGEPMSDPFMVHYTRTIFPKS